MDAVPTLDGGHDASAGLHELLEIVDEWLGDCHGASDAPTHHTSSESAPLASESTVSAPLGSQITANHGQVSGGKRQRERNTAVDMLRRLKKRAELSLLRVEHPSIQENHQLRGRVAKNDALLRSIRDALCCSITTEDKEGSTTDRSSTQCGDSTPPLESLLHLNLDYVLRKLPPLTAHGLVCSSETTVDASGSPRFEIKTATTLGCGIHAFSPLFIKQLQEKSSFAQMLLKCLATNERVFEDSDSREIRYLGATLILRSSGVIYKRDQANGEMILTRSTRMTHPDGAVGFQGRSWIIATRSPHSPAEMTTVRTLYELTPESIPSSVVSIDGEKPEKVRASLLRVLTERLRRKHAHLQHTLLVATGRGDLAAVLDV